MRSALGISPASVLALPFVAALAVALATAPAPAQTVDLNKWTIEHVNSTGTWAIDAPRLNAKFTNITIYDCSVLYSDFSAVGVLEFRISVDPVGDDDIIGFVLGFNPGDATNPIADYLLVDWKQVTQTFGNWGTAQAGLAVSRVTGVPMAGTGGGPIDLWSHTGVVTQLQRATTLGSTGWIHATNYFFRVVFTPASLDVWVNGQKELAVTGTFNTGRFGCYNFSQSGMKFQFPVAGSFTSSGAGCAGSAGTPSLFAPEPPRIGETFAVVIGTLPPTAPTVLVLGGSNQRWGTIALPFDLGAIGATGCKLYTSADLFVPVTNTVGTAFLNIRIPSDLVPNATFYAQGAAIDATANPLGLVFSNGAAGVVGIR